MVGVPDSMRGSVKARNERAMSVLNLFSFVIGIAPAFRPRLSVWTRIAVGALKFRVRCVLLPAFDVEIVKCAVDYLGACCADIEDSPYLPSGRSCGSEAD